jgi:hypothetical protein
VCEKNDEDFPGGYPGVREDASLKQMPQHGRVAALEAAKNICGTYHVDEISQVDSYACWGNEKGSQWEVAVLQNPHFVDSEVKSGKLYAKNR